VQGEYGGLGLVVKGHTWKAGGWGYDLFGTREALAERFEDFVRVLRRAEREGGLSAAVYTQTSDVETENNGLMTYDRAEMKIAPQAVRLALRGYFAPRVVRTAPIFLDSVRVALDSTSEGAEIRYTTDGTDPRRTSTLYRGPFVLASTATVKARAYYADGTASRVNAHGFAQVEPRPASDVPGARRGLVVDYFEGTREWRELPVFDSLIPANTGVVSAIDLRPSPRKEYFGLRFRGFVRVPETGVYGFQISSDDGSRLIIDGQTIADNDEIHGMGDRMGWVGLAAGLHRFELQYFQGCCGLGLRLTVDSPGGPRGPVSPASWFHEEGPRAR
jgi:hypothetical protein